MAKQIVTASDSRLVPVGFAVEIEVTATGTFFSVKSPRNRKPLTGHAQFGGSDAALILAASALDGAERSYRIRNDMPDAAPGELGATDSWKPRKV